MVSEAQSAMQSLVVKPAFLERLKKRIEENYVRMNTLLDKHDLKIPMPLKDYLPPVLR